MSEIWIADDDSAIRFVLRRALHDTGANTYASLGMHEADYSMYAKNFDPRISQPR